MNEERCAEELHGIADDLHRAVDDVEGVEGKSPGYYGGYIRSAERLVRFVAMAFKKNQI